MNEFSAPIPIMFFIGSVSIALFISFTFASNSSFEEENLQLDVEDIETLMKKANSAEETVTPSPMEKPKKNVEQHAYNKERRGSTALSVIYYQGIVKTKAAKAQEPPKSLKDRFKNQFEDVESSESDSGSSSDLITSSEESINTEKEKKSAIESPSGFGNYVF